MLLSSIPHLNHATDEKWLRSACRLQRYKCSKVLTDGRRTNGRPKDYHTISFPGAFGPGELKTQNTRSSRYRKKLLNLISINKIIAKSHSFVAGKNIFVNSLPILWKTHSNLNQMSLRVHLIWIKRTCHLSLSRC